MSTLATLDPDSVPDEQIHEWREYARGRVGPTIEHVADQRLRSRLSVNRPDDDVSTEREWLCDLVSVVQEAENALYYGTQKLYEDLATWRGAWEEYNQERGVAAAVSEWWSKAKPLEREDYDRIARCLESIQTSLDGDDSIYSAGVAFNEAMWCFNDVRERWYNFREAAIAGGEHVAGDLTVVRNVSFAIVASIASGGTAGAFGVTSVLGRAGIGAGYAMLARGTEAHAAYVGHIIAGTTESFNVDNEFVETLQEGVAAFGGEILGGVTDKLREMLIPKLAKSLEPWLRQEATTWAVYIVTDILKNHEQLVWSEIVKSSVHRLRQKTFHSTDEFLHALAEEWAEHGCTHVLEEVAGHAAEQEAGGFFKFDPTGEFVTSLSKASVH